MQPSLVLYVTLLQCEGSLHLQPAASDVRMTLGYGHDDFIGFYIASHDWKPSIVLEMLILKFQTV
jgi:hypothetical protein